GFFEGRREQDVFPTLYRMNTSTRVKKLAAQHDFLVESLRCTESSAQTVMLGPLVLLELLLIRTLRAFFLADFRSNLIVVWKKINEGAALDGRQDSRSRL